MIEQFINIQMEDSVSARRQEILENLKKEREKRREEIIAEDVEYNQEITHSFRSETIARLVKERRNQDIFEQSKANLQESLKEQQNLRQKSSKTNFDNLYSPKVQKTEKKIEFQSFISDEPEKPKKRDVKDEKKLLKEKKFEKNPEKIFEKKIEKKPEKKVQKIENSNLFNSENLSASEKELKRENFDKRIDELLRQKEENLKSREIEKRKKEEEELKGCSFAPQVTPYFTRPNSFEKIEDRLIKIGKEKQISREKVIFTKIIKEKEKSEAEGSNFVPKISENSANMIKNRLPIHKRVEELQKEKQVIINNLRNNLEAKSESNFKPRINSNSSRIINNKSTNEELSKDTKKGKLEELLKQEIENFTFTPQTMNKSGNLKSFLERQEEFLKKKEKNMQDKNNKEEICTFKPVINSNSKTFMQETEIDKFERMGKMEHEKREQKKAKIQEDYYGKFSHEPKINPVSKYMCRTHSTSEYKPQDPIENEENFSFKPKLDTNKKFSDVQSHYSNPEKILQKIEEQQKAKQEKLLNIKQEYESKEIKDCTFAPKLSEMTETKEVLIPGLEKFLA